MTRLRTDYQNQLLRRVEPFLDADGWRLMRQVDTTPERNCHGIPLEAFFPTAHEVALPSARRQERASVARACAGCPVADQCLAGALLRGEQYGGWGGVAQPDFRALLPIFHAERHQRLLTDNSETGREVA